MSGHTRLYRRNSTYYHRAAVPTDIRDTYGKREETFSLKTKDYREALRLVRIAAIEVDEKFEAHRRRLEQLKQLPLQELSGDQIKHIGNIYYAHLLEEDEETRLSSFNGGSFEECSGLNNFREFYSLYSSSNTLEKNQMTTRKERISFTPEQRQHYAKLMVEENYSNKKIMEISGAGASAVTRWKK